MYVKGKVSFNMTLISKTLCTILQDAKVIFMVNELHWHKKVAVICCERL